MYTSQSEQAVNSLRDNADEYKGSPVVYDGEAIAAGMSIAPVWNVHNRLEQVLELKRALKLKQDHYKGDHPDVADSLYDLGLAYEAIGDVRNGLDHKGRALIMRQALYPGEQHTI